MKFYLVSSALVLFITAPGIAAADKQRRRLRGSHVTDYSNYDEAIANAEDDQDHTSYDGYNNNNYNPGREVARESGYAFGHDGFPEQAASFAALAGGWTCDTRVCCGDETWAKCGLPGGASCNVSCNFKPGPDLDVFRNVDPDKFEWVDPQHIVARKTTCGYLKAPFGWPAGSKTGYTETPDQKQYPFVQVCKLLSWCTTIFGIM